MPKTQSALALTHQMDDGYPQLEKLIGQRIAEATSPLFRADMTIINDLYDVFLANIHDSRRQHYNCRTCRKFINDFGSVVNIDPATGQIAPLLFREDDAVSAPELFRDAMLECWRVVKHANPLNSRRVTGVFIPDVRQWGTRQTKTWTHLCGECSRGVLHRDNTTTAFQSEAERKQDFIMVKQAMHEYPAAVVNEALRVLRADALDRSEKTLGVAEWLAGLHAITAKGNARENLIWLGVATAPAGFAHIKSTMIGTLLEDIKAGHDFATVSQRWAKKMHPLQYRRTTAPVKEGQIKNAEKVVEQLGLTKSFERRAAVMADLQSPIWQPKTVTAAPAKPSGMFDHLRKTPAAGATPLELPAKLLTWVRFAREVLPTAAGIEFLIPAYGGHPFIGLVSAVHHDAEPVLQWDGLPGFPRNPVSWYFRVYGSYASEWSLRPGLWANVKGVYPSPAHWHDVGKMIHFQQMAILVLEGAVDTTNPANGMFTESMRAELHAHRAVMEAHIKHAGIKDVDKGDANGYAITDRSNLKNPVQLRVTDGNGTVTRCNIDRWQ